MSPTGGLQTWPVGMKDREGELGQDGTVRHTTISGKAQVALYELHVPQPLFF
jgi:hypothetical protein